MYEQIYLAHSVYQRTRGKQIQAALEKLGFIVYNPFYPNDKRAQRGDIEALDKGNIQPWDITDMERSKWIIEVDLRAVGNSNLIVCIYPNRRTVGIPCEMMYAWMSHIPIFTLVPEDMIGHPWIVGMSQEVVTTIEELYDILGKWKIRRIKHDLETGRYA